MVLSTKDEHNSDFGVINDPEALSEHISDQCKCPRKDRTTWIYLNPINHEFPIN